MTLPIRLAQVDREHFKIEPRVPGGFYWRSSPDLAWTRKTEVDGEICWWLLQRLQGLQQAIVGKYWAYFRGESKEYLAEHEARQLEVLKESIDWTSVNADALLRLFFGVEEASAASLAHREEKEG